jgi:hypothetical protein
LQKPPQVKPESDPGAVEYVVFHEANGRKECAPKAIVEAARDGRMRGLSQADVIREMLARGLIDVPRVLS